MSGGHMIGNRKKTIHYLNQQDVTMKNRSKILLKLVCSSFALMSTPLLAMDPFGNDPVARMFDEIERQFFKEFEQPSKSQKLAFPRVAAFRIQTRICNGVGQTVIEDLSTGEKNVIVHNTGQRRTVSKKTPIIEEITEQESEDLKETSAENQEESTDECQPMAQETPFRGFQFGQPMMGQEAEATQFQAYKPKTGEKVYLKDVLGQREAKKKVKMLVNFLKNPEQFKKLGAKMPRGILFVGDPGNGKTLMAKAVANEAGVPLYSVSGSEFVNKYVGVGADNIRKLVETVRKKGKGIIFIDEIDALIKKRSGDKNNEESDRTLNQLLVEMDGLNNNQGILFIGATNFVESLDSAATRPGRFEYKVDFKSPAIDEREKALKALFGKYTLSPSINKDEKAKALAEVTSGFSYASLESILNRAAIMAGIKGHETVSEKFINKAYDEMALGQKNNLKRTKLQKTRTSFHEIGHVVTALNLGEGIHKVSIESRGDAGGVMIGKEKYEHITDYTKEELVNKIAVCFGGLVAEELFCKCNRGGVSSDLEQAGRIARTMVRKFGMGKKNQGRAYPEDGQVSPETQQSFEQDEREILDESKELAKRVLLENEESVKKLTNKLLQENTLSEETIYQETGMDKPTSEEDEPDR